jgi:hypothetical protein
MALKTYLNQKLPLQQIVLINWLPTCQTLKLDPYLSPCTKINSKEIKNLNVRSETETFTGKSLENTGMGNYFLTRTPPAQEIGSTIGK